MEQPKQRPSFLSSVMAGVMGAVKGALALGAIAAVGGAAVGAIASGGAIPVALAFAGLAGYAGGLLGASIGGYTGVLQSREAAAPDAQDIINVANISFAQGVEVGHHQQAAQQSIAQVREAKNHFQEQLAAQRAGVGQVKGV